MDTMPTKDRILQAALTLFAEKGYDGVGVDLIAETAGIKGPSLYKHYKGKEAILNALLSKAEAHYESNFGSEQRPGQIPESMEQLVAVSMERIRFTLHDPMIQKIRRILTMEQFRSKQIAALATLHSIDSIQGLYTRLFCAMMEAGTLRRSDPGLLAMAFAAPVTLLIQQCDREPEHEEEILKRIESYLKGFAEDCKRQ